MQLSIRDVWKGALARKSIGRILSNAAIRTFCAGVTGRVLDVASGKAPGYLSVLPKTIQLVRTDVTSSEGVIALDMNARFPFEDAAFDAVFCFAALYIADDPLSLAREIRRVLKPGGSWFLGSPFIVNEMPEPHDYIRFTAEGLERLGKQAGFEYIEIHRLGDRGSSAINVLNPFLVLRSIRFLAFSCALLLDRMVPKRVRTQHPTPVAYFVKYS
ncbi:MAG: methyltransferase domain-containing protein [Candidatus Pacebacteria bacterium]|nr:methyltransferase domain-containing protein [Candidatus Paceibacterota bacterium]